MMNCPVCGNSEVEKVIVTESVPVLVNQQFDTALDSSSVNRGRIDLVICLQCGHFYNQEFNANLISYSARYENALHYSGVFRDYLERLAVEISENLPILGTRILEIGAGQGDFLAMLVAAGAKQGIGFDPSYRGGKLADRVEVFPELFNTPTTERFDLAIARHVLEHLENPANVLDNISKSLKEDGRIYIEVPNAMYTIKESGIWDLIYEHVSYFSDSSLQTVINQSGFTKIGLKHRYENQFLSISGKLGEAKTFSSDLQIQIHSLLSLAREFRKVYIEKIARWQEQLERWDKQNVSVFIWGAGSKGCTFVNLFRHHSCIKGLIDINPLKKGLFAAGTGLQILPPEALNRMKPDIVIVMNSIYQDEIQNNLQRLNLNTRIEAA